jgi:hypothetical protein
MWKFLKKEINSLMLTIGNVSNTQKRKKISSDLGARWTLLRSNNGNIRKILSPTPNKILFLSTDLFISNDGGLTWTATGLSAIANAAVSGTSINDISCSADGNVILATGGREETLSGQLIQFTYDGYFYLSTNGGVSWTTISSYGSEAWYKAQVSADGQKMYVFQLHGGGEVGSAAYTPNSGIWSSTNGGSTWSRLTSTINSQNVNNEWEMTISADGSVVYVMFVSYSGPPSYTSSFSVYKSINSGSTWTNVSPTITSLGSGFNPIAIKCSADGNLVFVAEREDFVVSTNGGTSWSSKNLWTNAFSTNLGDIACSTDGKYSYISGYDYPDLVRDIFVSQNYGQDWIRKNDPSLLNTDPNFYTNKISCTSDGLTAFVSDNNANLYKVSYI